MGREERVIVQDPVKEQQPYGMSRRGVQVKHFEVVVGGGRGPGGVIWGVGAGGGAHAPLTYPCPPSNHTITINLTLTFAAS